MKKQLKKDTSNQFTKCHWPLIDCQYEHVRIKRKTCDFESEEGKLDSQVWCCVLLCFARVY